MWAWVACVISVCVGWGVWKAWTRWTKKRRMIEAHRRLTRQVYGCMKCYRELLPPEARYSCGQCEYHDYCTRCWSAHRACLSDLHPHYLYQDAVYPEVDSSHLPGAKSVAEGLDRCLRLYHPRPLIGIRPPTSWDNGVEQSFAQEFQWLTYAEVRERALQFGTGLGKGHGLPQDTAVIGLYMASHPLWMVSHIAGMMKGYVIVPLHASFTAEQVAHVIQTARLSAIITSLHLLPQVQGAIHQLKSQNSVRLVVTAEDYACAYASRIDSGTDATTPLEWPSDVICRTWEQVQQLGAQSPSGEIQRLVHRSPDEMAVLLTTSGSTGMPKLTIFTGKRMLQQVHAARPTTVHMVVLSIEPLRQYLDLLSRGGRCGVFCGRLDLLMDDIRSLRPSVIGATPSFWNNLYSSYQQDQHQYLREHPDIPKEEQDSTFIEVYRARKLFGNRLQVVLVGGAPIHPAIQQWIFLALGAFVVNGYGTTETGAISSNNSISARVKIQLIDCPEMGYTTSDQPYPRGEIAAATQLLIDGYYNDEERTRESFIRINDEMYFRTGDIGEMRQGQIHVIDRKKSITKLAQGCFVAPERLETLYVVSPLVEQIFIYANAMHSCVSAVVVPTPLLPQQAKELDSSSLSVIRQELRKIGRSEGVATWEIPQIIILDEEPFTVQNGLLTTIGKLARMALTTRYKPDLEELYQSQRSLLSRSLTDVPDLSEVTESSVDESGLCQGVQVLLQSVLQLSPGSFQASDRLVDLGVDSLAMARLANTIKKQFGVDIPLPALVKLPSLLVLQTAIFSGLHAVSEELEENETLTTLLDEVDQLWKELDGDIGASSRAQGGSDPTILLTGANGFLGAFLMEYLLRDNRGYRLVCLIRATDDEGARTRLRESLSSFAIDVEEHMDRVEVKAGDVSQQYFGLSLEEYQALVKSVGVILHNAAMVNSIYSYEQHKPTNVRGTMNLLRFAYATNPPKPFHYISTVGVLGKNREECFELTSLEAPMGGYAQSKWVAERLIARVVDQYGGQPTVYRPSTIFAHSVTGAYNPKDTVIRLLLGMMKESIYPPFSRDSESATPSMLPGEMNLVPVDWVAHSIVELMRRPFQEPCGYHLCRDEATRMSELVQQMKDASVPMECVTEDQFSQQVQSISDPYHPLYMYKSLIAHRAYASSIFCPSNRATVRLVGSPPSVNLEPLLRHTNVE